MVAWVVGQDDDIDHATGLSQEILAITAYVLQPDGLSDRLVTSSKFVNRLQPGVVPDPGVLHVHDDRLRIVGRGEAKVEVGNRAEEEWSCLLYTSDAADE